MGHIELAFCILGTRDPSKKGYPQQIPKTDRKGASLEAVLWYALDMAVSKKSADTLAKRIIPFWFRDFDAVKPVTLQCRNFWFGAPERLDEQIKREFEEDLCAWRAEVNADQNGKYSMLSENPFGRLALMLLGDQVPRYIYRTSPRKYEMCALMRQFSWVIFHELHDKGSEEEKKQISDVQASFCIFPLLRAEHFMAARSAVEKARVATHHAPEVHRLYFRQLTSFAQEHLRVLEKFGRYPLRNELLGRESTPEEAEYLSGLKAEMARYKDKTTTGWAGGAKKAVER
eukprot:g76963.t1